MVESPALTCATCGANLPTEPYARLFLLDRRHVCETCYDASDFAVYMRRAVQLHLQGETVAIAPGADQEFRRLLAEATGTSPSEDYRQSVHFKEMEQKHRIMAWVSDGIQLARAVGLAEVELPDFDRPGETMRIGLAE